MAQPAKKSLDGEVLTLLNLKVDNKGWKIELFDEASNVSNYLCTHCASVCCDAAELGCEHEEDDIFLYCKQCLTDLVKDNDNKCMISSHINPPLLASRATRRLISKSMVLCPYSLASKKRNVIKKKYNTQIMTTVGAYDEKEGSQQYMGVSKGCEWKGMLNDLIKTHIFKCAKQNDPTFTLNIKIKELVDENQILQKFITDLSANINEKQKEINDKTNELNGKNSQVKRLKEIMKEKERTINEQSLMIKDLINLITSLKHQIKNNEKHEEKKQNESNNKSILESINIFKGDKHCIVDIKNSIFTTKGVNSTTTATFAILQRTWSKYTNGGIHYFKLKCLQSALNCICIGMTTNSKANTNGNPFFFHHMTSGLSYQLYGGSWTGIYHHKHGKQQYEEKLPKIKPISPQWIYNTYAPNETVSMRLDCNKWKLQFFINTKKVGKTVNVEPNTYYPAIVYGVCNKYFEKHGALRTKVMTLY